MRFLLFVFSILAILASRAAVADDIATYCLATTSKLRADGRALAAPVMVFSAAYASGRLVGRPYGRTSAPNTEQICDDMPLPLRSDCRNVLFLTGEGKGVWRPQTESGFQAAVRALLTACSELTNLTQSTYCNLNSPIQCYLGNGSRYAAYYVPR